MSPISSILTTLRIIPPPPARSLSSSSSTYHILSPTSRGASLYTTGTDNGIGADDVRSRGRTSGEEDGAKDTNVLIGSDGAIDSLSAVSILPPSSFGIELHPDTFRYLAGAADDPGGEGGGGLSEAFGGNSLNDFFENGLVLACAFSACLGGLLFGFDQGLVSITLVMPQFLKTFPEIDKEVMGAAAAEFNKGYLTSMLELGALLGSLLSPYLADTHSRRFSLFIGLVFFICGSTIQTMAGTFGRLVGGRMVGGVGVGVLSSTAPMYVSEIAPPNIRGALLVIEQFMIVLGIVVMFYITYAAQHIASEMSFRLPFFLQMIPGFFLAIILIFLPYSPRWLSSRSRDSECLETLCRLRKLPPSDPRVQAEWILIRAEAIHSREAFLRRHPDVESMSGLKREWVGWKEMFGREIWKRTRIGMGIHAFQQFVGINSLIYYSPTLFETLGLEYDMRLKLSGWMNIAQLAAVLVTFVALDRMGRKPWLLIGSAGMFVAHVVVAVMIAKYSSDWSAHPSAALTGILAIFLFMISFGLSWGPIAWLIPAEVHSSSYRAKGVALSTSTNWTCNTIIGLITPPLVERTGGGAFAFFAGWAGLSGVFAWVVVPETKGKTLEDIDAIFHSSTGKEDEIRKRQILDLLCGEGGRGETSRLLEEA